LFCHVALPHVRFAARFPGCTLRSARVLIPTFAFLRFTRLLITHARLRYALVTPLLLIPGAFRCRLLPDSLHRARSFAARWISPFTLRCWFTATFTAFAFTWILVYVPVVGCFTPRTSLPDSPHVISFGFILPLRLPRLFRCVDCHVHATFIRSISRCLCRCVRVYGLLICDWIRVLRILVPVHVATLVRLRSTRCVYRMRSVFSRLVRFAPHTAFSAHLGFKVAFCH